MGKGVELGGAGPLDHDGTRRDTGRAGNRHFCLSSALCAHTKAPYKTDLLWETLRALNRPGRARTVSRPVAFCPAAHIPRCSAGPLSRTRVASNRAQSSLRAHAGITHSRTASAMTRVSPWPSRRSTSLRARATARGFSTPRAPPVLSQTCLRGTRYRVHIEEHTYETMCRGSCVSLCSSAMMP